MAGDRMTTIRIGVGGWTYNPWRGVFYPSGLPQARELYFLSRALTSIEVNGTYYSRFKPASWRRWRDQTPDDFVFAIKGSRFCTNRKVLADAGPSITRFLDQGLVELGPKLGPIVWQLMATKRFDRDDVAGFLALLPKDLAGAPLRHAIEARHPSFADPAFHDLAREQGVAVVRTEIDGPDDGGASAPSLTYARLRTTHEEVAAGVSPRDLRHHAAAVRRWASRGDVFAYFISGAKVRNPAAARALIATLDRRGRA